MNFLTTDHCSMTNIVFLPRNSQKKHCSTLQSKDPHVYIAQISVPPATPHRVYVRHAGGGFGCQKEFMYTLLVNLPLVPAVSQPGVLVVDEQQLLASSFHKAKAYCILQKLVREPKITGKIIKHLLTQLFRNCVQLLSLLCSLWLPP